jgi:hypothetical protein
MNHDSLPLRRYRGEQCYGFVMALYLDSLGQSSQAVSAKTRRLLSDNSTENAERLSRVKW